MFHTKRLLNLGRCFFVGLLLLTSPARADDSPWTPEEALVFQQGQDAMRANRFQEAVRILQPLEETHPSSGALHRILGHALAGAGRTAEARSMLIEAFSLGQMTSDVLARLVEIDHAAGRNGAVLASTRMLLLLEPDDPSWLRTYADLLLSAGENAAARVAYEALAERHGADAEIYDRLGRIALEDGRERDAVIAWETSYWTSPELSADMAERISSLWVRLGDDERSLEWAELQHKTKSDDRSNLRRAELLFAMSDYAGATIAAGELRESADGSLADRAMLLMGHCAYRSGDVSKAIECWNECLASDASSADLCGFAGRMCVEAAQHVDAIRFLEQAVAAREDDPHLRSMLVRSLLATDDGPAAKAHLVGYLEFHGLDPLGERLLREYAQSLAQKES